MTQNGHCLGLYFESVLDAIYRSLPEYEVLG
jgi:hypothetical protein